MGWLRSWITALVGLRFLPFRWQIPCFLMFGAAAGTGVFLLHISRATSYLSDASETCMNCHVMTTQYLTWQHSSHARVAACNDCHVPHTSMAAHWAFKAKDGLWHATVFTMRWEPQVIRLSRGAIPVVEENCRRCHAAVIEDVSLRGHARASHGAGQEKGTGTFSAKHPEGRSGKRCLSPFPAGDLRCWDCHREVPHGRTRSLSATPNVFQPRLPSLQSVDQQPRIGGRVARPTTESPP